MTSALLQEIQMYQSEVESCRRKYNSCLGNGFLPSSLQEELKQLNEKEKELSERALPLLRRKVLETRDPHAEITTILKHGTSLKEAGFSDELTALCQELTAMDLSDPKAPENITLPSDCYLSIFNESAGFCFLADGKVQLMENDDGFLMRQSPIVTDCFVQNACMETSHSCLMLDLDQNIQRLSFQRLESLDDLSLY